MIKNYLKIAFRSLMKNKVFVIINLLGMSIAIACAIVAYLNYEFNDTFDIEHVNAQNIYRINVEREFNGNTIVYGLAPRPVGGIIRENVQGLDHVINMTQGFGSIKLGEDHFGSAIIYADPGFFEMFTFDIVKGNIDLTDKSQIAISDKVAEKYFGNVDPIGQPLTHVTADGIRDYRVTAVFKAKPMNSSFAEVSMVTTYENYFSTYADQKEGDFGKWNLTFVQFSGQGVEQVLLAELSKHVEAQNIAREDFQIGRYFLDPLPGMAVRSQNNNYGTMIVNSAMPPPAVAVPMIMASMLLLLACFNFANTSIAVAGKRLKEIGLRKVMGSYRSQLVIQFLTENILLCFVSLILGLFLAELLVPIYSEMWPFLEITIDYSKDAGLIFFLSVLLILTSLIAGSYPAFYVTRFSPTEILRRKERYGGAGIFSKILLVFQFSISLLCVIFATAFIRNAEYQQNFDLGYTSHGILHLGFDNAADLQVFRNRIEQEQWHTSLASTQHQFNESFINDPVWWEEKSVETDILFVNEEFLSTMDVQILSGRDFKSDSETDVKESVIVSETFVDAMQWNKEEVIGKRLIWHDTVQLYVIGVVENLYTRALWDKMEPSIFRVAPKEDYRILTVKTDPSNVKQAYERMEVLWKEMFPNKLYTGEYFDVEQTNSGMVNGNITKMFSFLGLVAIMLAASGLYSLVSLNILKRMKEVAVRKVLGATITHVIWRMNRPFVMILISSGFLGCLGGIIFANGLMDEIWAYHIQVGADILLISASLIFLMAVVTIGMRVYRAASANPATTLRSE